MCRTVFPEKSDHVSSEMLDLIHSDVCGPMQTETPSGRKYFVIFIDDYSKYMFIYLLKNKSEVFEKIIEFIEKIKTSFQKKPKIMRSDRGGEYTSERVHNYFRKEDLTFQYTAPYSPQQNGVS